MSRGMGCVIEGVLGGYTAGDLAYAEFQREFPFFSLLVTVVIDVILLQTVL
jgi:hypothetical protein